MYYLIDINLLQLFRNVTKQILTECKVVQCCPTATLHNFRALFFSVDLGASQYLYNVCPMLLCREGELH